MTDWTERVAEIREANDAVEQARVRVRNLASALALDLATAARMGPGATVSSTKGGARPARGRTGERKRVLYRVVHARLNGISANGVATFFLVARRITRRGLSSTETNLHTWDDPRPVTEEATQ